MQPEKLSLKVVYPLSARGIFIVVLNILVLLLSFSASANDKPILPIEGSEPAATLDASLDSELLAQVQFQHQPRNGQQCSND